MKRFSYFFVLSIFVFGLICYLINNATRENNKIKEERYAGIEIIDKRMDIKGHNILVPQISGDKNTVQYLNKMIIKKIEWYIDKESSLYDFGYIVKYNNGRYVSIIIEMTQYKKTLPHPGKQAHAINLDFKKKKLLDNNDLVPNQKQFCEDIKCGRYTLLSENEIPNNVAYPSGYIENKKIDEIEEMYNNKELEIFIANRSLGFVAIVPYAIGNYAIFERVK